MTTPNKHIPYVPEGTLDPAAGLNLALNFIDALLQTAVISMDLLGPPGSPVDDGALYIVAGTGGTATGDWALHELDLARYVLEGDYWQFFEAGSAASLIVNLEDGNLYKYVDGSPPSWVLAAGLGDAPNDGEAYFRRNEAWSPFFPLTVTDEGSPPSSESDVTELIMVGVTLEILTGGVVRVVFPDVGTATVLTSVAEPSLPNARVLVAGHGTRYDDSVANVRTLEVTPIPTKEWRNIDASLPTPVGATAMVLVGTASTPAKSTGGPYNGYIGRRRSTSATAANSVASFRSGNAQDEAYSGTTGPSRTAGFHMRMRFGTGAVVAGERFFVGMALNVAEAGTVDPSALLNCFGVAKDGADANFQIMHNDGSGAATKVNLGLAFATNKFFDLELYVPAGGGSWRYILLDLDTGVTYSGTISTNIPANNVGLYWRLWSSVGAASGTAVAVDLEYVGLRYPL